MTRRQRNPNLQQLPGATPDAKRIKAAFSKAPATPKPKLGPGDANWERECGNCDASPVVECSGLCGPCHFGDADTAGGNW